MKKEETVKFLMKRTEEVGFIAALHEAFGASAKFKTEFSESVLERSIDSLDFSVRASNALKRSGVHTVGGVIELIGSDSLIGIRNLGKKTQNEIKTRILLFSFEELSPYEKRRFFETAYDLNDTGMGGS